MGNLQREITNIYISLVLFGAFLLVIPPTILGIPYQIFSVPLRYLLLFASFYYIVVGFLKRRYIYEKTILLYILFWGGYLLRVVVDIEIRMIPNFVFATNMGYYQAIAYCFFTSLSFFFIPKADLKKVAQYCYVILLISCLGTLFVNIGQSAEKVQAVSGRLEGAEGISSIDYGHYGVSLSLLSIMLLFRGGGAKIKKLFYVFGFGLGIFVMYLAGSRSPFLALLLCLLSFQIFNQGAIKGAFYLLIICLPFILYFDQIMMVLDQYGSSFISRLTSAMEGDSSGRDTLFSTGLDQFLTYPLFGDSFLISNGFGTGIYAHNLVLESFMALGFFGGILFLYFLLKGIRIAYNLLRENKIEMWIGLLFIQQAILAMASLSIYTHVKYWSLLVLLLNLTKTKIVYRK